MITEKDMEALFAGPAYSPDHCWGTVEHGL
jgi:hypothetical protein